MLTNNETTWLESSPILNVGCIKTMRTLEVACINTMRTLSYVQNANVQISPQCCITCSRVSLHVWLMSFGGDLKEGGKHSALLCNNTMHFRQSISRKVIFLIITLTLLHPGSKIQRQSYVGLTLYTSIFCVTIQNKNISMKKSVVSHQMVLLYRYKYIKYLFVFSISLSQLICMIYSAH